MVKEHEGEHSATWFSWAFFEKDNKCNFILFYFVTYYLHTTPNKICMHLYSEASKLYLLKIFLFCCIYPLFSLQNGHIFTLKCNDLKKSAGNCKYVYLQKLWLHYCFFPLKKRSLELLVCSSHYIWISHSSKLDMFWNV